MLTDVEMGRGGDVSRVGPQRAIGHNILMPLIKQQAIMEKWTIVSSRIGNVMTFSCEEALRLGHHHIGIAHIFLGVLREENGTAVRILYELGCDLQRFKTAIEETFEASGPSSEAEACLPLTREAERVMANAIQEAARSQAHKAGTEHLLLSVLSDQGNVVSEFLMREYGLNYECVSRALRV